MIFGIVLLVIGLVAYFYRTTIAFGYSYPYQGLGTALSILGIIFVAIPLLLEYWSSMREKLKTQS
jgi:heme/copper-type cytochrome/quinol oxidase subunit 2